MDILYVFLISFFTIFLESFLVALGNFRISFLLVLCFFNKINWKYLLLILSITSLILDVIYHYTLGTNLLLVSLSLFVFLGFSLIVPPGVSIPGYVVKFVCIFLYYTFVLILPNLILTGTWTNITIPLVGGILVKSLVSLVFCVIFDLVWGRIRQKNESNKLRLQ